MPQLKCHYNSTNKEARKRLEAAVGKDIVREFVSTAGRKIVIVDAKETETTWDVFILFQATTNATARPWSYSISKAAAAVSRLRVIDNPNCTNLEQSLF